MAALFSKSNSVTLTIEHDTREADKKFGELARKHIRAILPQALNAAARDVRKHTIDEVHETHRLGKRVLGGLIVQGRRAKVRSPRTEVIGAYRSISFHKLGAVVQTPEGVRVPVIGFIAGAFVARMPTGHVGVFRRRRPTRRVGAGARRRPKERGSLPIVEKKFTFQRSAHAALLVRGDVRARIIFRIEFESRLIKRLKRKGII